MALSAKQLREQTERTCKTSAQLLQRRDEMSEQMHRILSTANRQGRNNSTVEREEALVYLEESERIGDMPLPAPMRDSILSEGDELQSSAATFIDKNGRRLHALRPHERLADLALPDNKPFHPLSLGKAIVGLLSGRWENARAEKLAMSEGSNAGGGYIFGDVFSKTIIDLARAQTRVVQAGALTVPWTDGDTLIMARVTTDPTFSVVPENEQIPPSQPTFDQVVFNAVKIATIVPISRELAEDAPNAAGIVEQTLTRAFAAELDRLALVGALRPCGVLNYKDVNATDSVGAIAWEDVHAAKVEVENGNFTPTGYICSPNIGGDLDLITSGDGTNAAKLWLGPPPSLNRVPRFTTKNCPDANLFIGDWSQLVIGIRTDAALEITSSGGLAFEKHQLLVKLTFRGDVGLLHSAGFHVLRGITK